jgi:hypothetical protein
VGCSAKGEKKVITIPVFVAAKIFMLYSPDFLMFVAIEDLTSNCSCSHFNYILQSSCTGIIAIRITKLRSSQLHGMKSIYMKELVQEWILWSSQVHINEF